MSLIAAIALLAAAGNVPVADAFAAAPSAARARQVRLRSVGVRRAVKAQMSARRTRARKKLAERVPAKPQCRILSGVFCIGFGEEVFVMMTAMQCSLSRSLALSLFVSAL
jgi:hypothetical protein